jgi:hypothetical protein
LAQDASETGIGIIYPKPLQIGQSIDVELAGRLRSAVVCRIGTTTDGHCLIGCRFASSAEIELTELFGDTAAL